MDSYWELREKNERKGGKKSALDSVRRVSSLLFETPPSPLPKRTKTSTYLSSLPSLQSKLDHRLHSLRHPRLPTFGPTLLPLNPSERNEHHRPELSLFHTLFRRTTWNGWNELLVRLEGSESRGVSGEHREEGFFGESGDRVESDGVDWFV